MPGTTAIAPIDRSVFTRPVVLKASRPALIDLRFKGDAWVVARGRVASVCLGDFPLGHVAISPLDIVSLNRTLGQVRTGQARRACHQRLRRPM